MNAEYIRHEIIKLEYDNQFIHVNETNAMSLVGTTKSDPDNEFFSLELTVSISNENNDKFFVLITKDIYKNTENCKPDLAGITDQYMAKLLEETDKDIAKIVELLQLSFMNIPKISELNKDDFVAR